MLSILYGKFEGSTISLKSHRPSLEFGTLVNKSHYAFRNEIRNVIFAQFIMLNVNQ